MAGPLYVLWIHSWDLLDKDIKRKPDVQVENQPHVTNVHWRRNQVKYSKIAEGKRVVPPGPLPPPPGLSHTRT